MTVGELVGLLHKQDFSMVVKVYSSMDSHGDILSVGTDDYEHIDKPNETKYVLIEGE